MEDTMVEEVDMEVVELVEEEAVVFQNFPMFGQRTKHNPTSMQS